MRVICKINNLNNIHDSFVLERLKKYISKPDGDVDLVIDQEYKVYGVVFWDNSPWFYLYPEDYEEYPKPFSSEFFEVVDNTLSSFWKMSSFSQGEHEAVTLLVFDEWAKDPSFYEKLIEGESEAVETFAKYKNLIDQE